MDEKQQRGISKYLSYILRHHPESAGITLDENGWADVEELIQKSAVQNIIFTFEQLNTIVIQNDKQRFIFNESRTMIRASQGHSVAIDLQLTATIPPATLYHGTVAANLENILLEGLKKMERQHVHLSRDIDTAQKVGSRRGKPVILRIDAERMYADGHLFFLSANGVWLTAQVPSTYIAAH